MANPTFSLLLICLKLACSISENKTLSRGKNAEKFSKSMVANFKLNRQGSYSPEDKMKYLLPIILLLGCSSGNPQRQIDGLIQLDETSGDGTDSSESRDDTANQKRACEGCEYLRFKVDLITYPANYDPSQDEPNIENHDAFIDIRIPKGKLATCELEGVHLCLRDKETSTVYNFNPSTTRGTFTDDAIHGGISHNAAYKKDGTHVDQQAVTHCIREKGIVWISAFGPTGSPLFKEFTFHPKDTEFRGHSYVYGKEIEYDPDDTCLADEQ